MNNNKKNVNQINDLKGKTFYTAEFYYFGNVVKRGWSLSTVECLDYITHMFCVLWFFQVYIIVIQMSPVKNQLVSSQPRQVGGKIFYFLHCFSSLKNCVH